MEQQICNCYKCKNTLRIFDELVMGVCEPHINKLLSDNHYVGICWECGKITIVAPKGDLVKDKYIFSKGCKSCKDSDKDNIDWMTIKKETPPTTEIPKKGPIKYIKIEQSHISVNN